jgi:ABC-type amino acid transport substrate-binding protein
VPALLLTISLLFGLARAQPAPSQVPTPSEPAYGDELVVAIKSSPPFSMKDAQGNWSGISYELWEAVARESDRPFRLEERTLAQMLQGLEDGSVDVAVAALTVTAEREVAFDFTQPFYQGGLGIAVPRSPRSSFGLVWRVLSPTFLQTIGGLFLVLFASGALMWVFERRVQGEPGTGDRGVNSLFDAFWWSAVTMTTVGYGDRIPQTTGGRIVAMVWMFSGIVLISSFTATISSVLTVSQLESEIDGPEDLVGVRVGTVASSTSARWCDEQRLYAELYESPEQALEALVRGEVGAVVYDAPVLQYLTYGGQGGRRGATGNELSVLPHVFDRQNYAIGLRQGLEGREQLNQNLLKRVESPWYRELTGRYLGD